MSVLVSGLVWERSEHKGSDLLVLLAIADNAKDSGLAYPGTKYLSVKTRLVKRSVQYAIERLLAGDELVIEEPGGGRRSNLYRIQVDVLRGKTPRNLCDPEAEETYAKIASVPTQALRATHATDCVAPTQPVAPEPSVEPSVEPSEPPTPLIALIWGVADLKACKRPPATSIDKAIADFPDRDAMLAAKDFAYWAEHGNGATRKIKSVAGTYRNFLQRSDPIASAPMSSSGPVDPTDEPHSPEDAWPGEWLR